MSNEEMKETVTTFFNKLAVDRYNEYFLTRFRLKGRTCPKICTNKIKSH